MIKNSSRVPAYQNLLKVVGFCDFQVASSPYRGRPWWGWMLLCFFLRAEESKKFSFFLLLLSKQRKNKKEFGSFLK